MKSKSLLLILLFCFVLSLPTMAQNAPPGTKAKKPLPGESIYNLQSSWTAQDGKTVNISSLRGQPVVVAMIYTSCIYMCPLTVQDMQLVDLEISKQPHKPVRFILFSMDPAKDTPERLKEFAGIHHLDLERWTLFHGDEKAVRGLAAALGARYKRKPDGNFDHSGIITLLDSDGIIAYQRVGEAEDLSELMNKVKQLVREPDKP